MSLAATVVPFLPASNLFFRVGFVIAERVLYLPSVGFCLLIVIGLRQLSSVQRVRQVSSIHYNIVDENSVYRLKKLALFRILRTNGKGATIILYK